MLIQRADVFGATTADVRVEAGRIVALGQLEPKPGESIIAARGGALLPGLHDHHLHLLSLAAALESVVCGPPEVTNEAALIRALRSGNARRREWIRGIGYHESVAGDIDRDWLDRVIPETPVRIQHRSGRLWIVNSAGLDLIAAPAAPRNGRLFDQDLLMRGHGAALPDVRSASERLARYGVTGFTDMTPRNDASTLTTFAQFQHSGELKQRVCIAGTLALCGLGTEDLCIGPTKVHLHESALPTFEHLCEIVSQSHTRDRAVAIHCVTEVELVFALAALREAQPMVGDRIEHASVTPHALLEQIHELGLTVVTQPNFVTERGDAYLAEIPRSQHAALYRCRTFLDRGVPLAAGTDAPFGDADPWAAMRAAVARRTSAGFTLGAHECLTPEQALALFLGAAATPAKPRDIAVGATADLCLLDRPWAMARTQLTDGAVRSVWRNGVSIFDRVDQTPR